ncbi:Hypothetical protein NTJ_05490 [Nesidiocoris tenuis]|uniref:Uncharacterized protein n=1 Tax=Nesidiocoris tenuis TaxID=355587 RepID=A0ABN7AK98_9HEMI|nr:Hypothetical protein NTJ_05490 [Nesidiocoris tenuis]
MFAEPPLKFITDQEYFFYTFFLHYKAEKLGKKKSPYWYSLERESFIASPSDKLPPSHDKYIPSACLLLFHVNSSPSHVR